MPNFLKEPNLPSGKVCLAAIGGKYAAQLEEALATYGVKLLCCPDNPCVDARLGSHIDLSVFHIAENRFLLAKQAAESRFAEALIEVGAEIIVSEKNLSSEYPNDAPLCALSINGKIFHNRKFSDRYIASENPGSFFHVKQGYAKCAVCPVAGDAAISSDKGIASEMRERGIEVLEIAPGHVALQGYAEGFIGGASFKISADTLAFTGLLDEHPDRVKIEHFLERHGVLPVYLTDKQIFDVGSVIPVLEV
ncbi:MAG: hypothetical protein VB064_04690 [Oscillospiraceae bacterium]|nr:hypothetical protein [Oscillospiraceae bacterium]